MGMLKTFSSKYLNTCIPLTLFGILNYMGTKNQIEAKEKPRSLSLEHNHHHHDPDESKSTLLTPKEQQHLEQQKHLFELDHELVQLTQNRILNLKEHQQLKSKLTYLQEKLHELENTMSQQRQALLKGMTLRRRLKSARLAEMFLNVDGPFDLKRREVYLELIFKGYAEQLVSFHRTQKEFAHHEKQIRPLEEKARRILEKLQAEEAILVNKRQEEWKLLEALNPTLPFVLSSNQNQDPFQNQNQPLLPPARGQWKDQFKRFRGYSQSRLYGNGLEIQGKEFSPVYSIYHGKVIYVGRVQAWGDVVMIDHQNGLISLYAGLAEATVTLNQKVTTQFRIGSIGSIHQTPSLYFELRKLGFPVDPKRWLDLSSWGKIK